MLNLLNLCDGYMASISYVFEIFPILKQNKNTAPWADLYEYKTL